jgi:hypothetical protein
MGVRGVAATMMRISAVGTPPNGEMPKRPRSCGIAGFYWTIALVGAFHARAAILPPISIPVGEQSIRVAIPAGFANAAQLGSDLLSYVQTLVGDSGRILGLLLTPADIDRIRLGQTPALNEFLSVTTDSEWSSRVMTHAQFTTELVKLRTQLERNAGVDSSSNHLLDGSLIERFSIRPNCEGFLMAYGPVSVQGAAPRSAIQGIAILHVRGKLLFLQVTRLQDSLTATERTKQILMSWAKDIDSLNAGERPSP